MDRWPRLAVIVWSLIVVAGVGRAALYHLPRHCGCYDVFADGGRHWLNSEPVYNLDHPDSLVVFRYSPLVAVGCTPLALVSAPLGSAILRFANLAVLIGGLAWWGRTVLDSQNERAKWWLLVALASEPALLDVQLNLITLGFMLIGTAAFSTGRLNLTAAALSFAVCLKAYPIALALLFVVVEPRRFAPRFLAAMVLVVALPFVFQAPGYVVQQYRDWLHGGLNPRYVDGAFQDVMYLWLRWIGPIERATFLAASVVSGVSIAVIVFARCRASMPTQSRGHGTLMVFGLSSAWMMAFGPSTEATTYVLLAPIAALAAVRAMNGPMSTWMRSIVGVAYGLLALSQVQLLFPLGRPFHQIGAQPIAALLLLLVFACWPSKQSGGTNSEARPIDGAEFRCPPEAA